MDDFDTNIPKLNVSYKPQKFSQESKKTVRNLLQDSIYEKYTDIQFKSSIMKPLLIEQLMDKKVVDLSGGEMQRVAICLCLGKVPTFFVLCYLASLVTYLG